MTERQKDANIRQEKKLTKSTNGRMIRKNKKRETGPTREKEEKDNGRSSGVTRDEQMRREIRAMIRQIAGPELEMIYAISRKIYARHRRKSE